MKKLSASAFSRARDFIRTQARPLERALFAHEFEEAPRAPVLDALSAYQNDDGGFGRALEPDVRLSESSAIATLTGLDVLRDVGARADEPSLRHALAWVVESFAPALPGWRAVPESVDAYPHAPWWSSEHHREGGSNDAFLVPGARLLSHLQHWSVLAPESLVAGYTEAFRAHFATVEAPIGGDGLYYASTVADARLGEKLEALALVSVSREPREWTGYVAKPLKLAPLPDSRLAAVLADLVAVNLDWEIDRQASDGGWEPNWTWFGSYEADWPAARREWRGELTLKALRSLRAFGRIEGR